MAIHLLESVLSVVFPLPPKDEALLSKSGVELARRLQPSGELYLRYKTIAGYHYRDEEARNLVYALKFKGSKKAADLCGFLLGEQLLPELESLYLFEGFIDPLLVPIPLSAHRYRERGYNQAARLAQALEKEHKGFGTFTPHALLRTRDTKAQSHIKSRAERAENVAGAFKVPEPSVVSGRNIILIDDVITSGRTAEEAADALTRAGARFVLIAAFAH